jgi:hypothetical protein
MKRLFFTLLTASLMGVSATSIAGETQSVPAASEIAAAQPFVKKRYSIKGEWSLITVDGAPQIIFSEDFKTKGGPDLKVYLAKKPIAELESATVSEQSTRIAVLKSNRGAQSYTIPEDVSLADFKSVVIHCEAFSVLWGGFDLPETP